MKLFALAAGILLGLNAMACDVCGAVNSALGLGTVAAGNRHAIGCTYQYRSYKSNHPGIFNEPAVSSSERFQRLDLNRNHSSGIALAVESKFAVGIQ